MEFHAIVCCGRGHNLAPFSTVRSTGIPKALIPIANKPMIEYVLEWCDKACFRKITVVTETASSELILDALDTYKRKRVAAEVESLGSIDHAIIDAETTGDIIQSLKDKIVGDFVILPCDFITDLPPQILIESYRNRSDSDIGLCVHYNNKFENVEKKSLNPDFTFFAELEDGHKQLLDLYTKESLVKNKSLQVRTQMCWRYPNSTVSTKLLNSFIYFCSPKVIEIHKKELDKNYSRSITKTIRDLARRSWQHSTTRETIGFFILPSQCTFLRTNNLSVYMEANRWLMRIQAQNSAQGSAHLVPAPKEKGAATVGADSLVGENTTLEERTSVKRSVVGDNSTIGKRCRLNGCIILGGVKIGDDVHLENCIIGTKAVLNSKSRLTNCNVEGNFIVPKGTVAKGENLTNLHLEGIVSQSSSESENDDSDEGSDEYDSYEVDDDIDDDDGLFG